MSNEKHNDQRCTHLDKDGYLNLMLVWGHDKRCLNCGAVFSLEKFTEVNDSNMHDVAHQLRSFLALEGVEIPEYVYNYESEEAKNLVREKYFEVISNLVEGKDKAADKLCTHTDEKGAMTAYPVSKNVFKCSQCESEFSIEAFSEITDENIHDAAHQLRLLLSHDKNGVPDYVYNYESEESKKLVKDKYFEVVESLTKKTKRDKKTRSESPYASQLDVLTGNLGNKNNDDSSMKMITTSERYGIINEIVFTRIKKLIDAGSNKGLNISVNTDINLDSVTMPIDAYVRDYGKILDEHPAIITITLEATYDNGRDRNVSYKTTYGYYDDERRLKTDVLKAVQQFEFWVMTARQHRCTHHHDNGVSALTKEGATVVRCNLCTAEFHVMTLTELNDLNIHTAAHQLKMLLTEENVKIPEFVFYYDEPKNRAMLEELYMTWVTNAGLAMPSNKLSEWIAKLLEENKKEDQ